MLWSEVFIEERNKTRSLPKQNNLKVNQNFYWKILKLGALNCALDYSKKIGLITGNCCNKKITLFFNTIIICIKENLEKYDHSMVANYYQYFGRSSECFVVRTQNWSSFLLWIKLTSVWKVRSYYCLKDDKGSITLIHNWSLQSFS